MPYLEILHSLLIQFGGGDGTPDSDLSRHFLASFMWLMIFATSKLLKPIYQFSSDAWLLNGILFALFVELSNFIVKLWCLAQGPQLPGESLSIIGKLWEPIAVGLYALSFLYLSFGMISFISLPESRTNILRAIWVGTLCLITITIGVTLHWYSVIVTEHSAQFEHSIDLFILTLACVTVVSYATWRLWSLRSHATLSRTAWIPFGLYLFAHLLLLTAVQTNPLLGLWLLPIYGNLMLWTIPWFGFLYLRNLHEQHQSLTHQLHQSERLDVVGRLAAGVAHDFSNHLQSIMGFAELGLMNCEVLPSGDSRPARCSNAYDSSEIVRTECEKNTEQKNSDAQYRNIINVVQRARLLVKQLITFKHDELTCDVRVLRLSEFLEDLDPMIHGLLGPGLKMHNLIDVSADLVRVDRSMLEQAIVNLIVNARDAMPGGGTLTIGSRALNAEAAGKQHAMIRLNITDTGKGMTAYERSRVFEPFYTTKGKTTGTGLGLTSSLAAIRQMGGEMHIESVPGKGTTLIIDLPAAESFDHACPDGAADNVSIDQIGGTERILLAENEPGLRHIAAMQLRRAGYQITTACDGQEAIDFLVTNTDGYDLMVLDISMPRKDGYVVFEQARQLCPGIPVVFVTANASASGSAEINRQPKLLKPVLHTDLLKIVRHTLDRQPNDYNPTAEVSALV